MGKSLSSRMKPIQDEEYCFPVYDCTNCRKKNVPFNEYWTDREPFIKFIYCLNCLQTTEIIKPSGYVSMIDLEEMEWDTEL